MEKYRNKYRIISSRLQSWDYAWSAAYCITLCTHHRECFFGEIKSGKMQLFQVGVIADILWYEIKNHTKNVDLGEFQVMPNHIHGILILNGNDLNGYDNLGDNDGNNDGDNDGVETRHALSLQPHALSLQPLPQSPGKNRFQNQGKNTVSSIIGSYKSAVTKHAHRLGYTFKWQSRFYDHIVRSNDEYQRITNYIIDNPKRWNKDKFRK